MIRGYAIILEMDKTSNTRPAPLLKNDYPEKLEKADPFPSDRLTFPSSNDVTKMAFSLENMTTRPTIGKSI